ncbi:MAG: hypothetical protein V4591_10675 [Bdellovibrionota bacterium]
MVRKKTLSLTTTLILMLFLFVESCSNPSGQSKETPRRDKETSQRPDSASQALQWDENGGAVQLGAIPTKIRPADDPDTFIDNKDIVPVNPPNYTISYNPSEGVTYRVDALGYLHDATGYFNFNLNSGQAAQGYVMFPNTAVPYELKNNKNGAVCDGFGLSTATPSDLSKINLTGIWPCLNNYLAYDKGISTLPYNLNPVFFAGQSGLTSSSNLKALRSPLKIYIDSTTGGNLNTSLATRVEAANSTSCGTTFPFTSGERSNDNRLCLTKNYGGYSDSVLGKNADSNKWRIPYNIPAANGSDGLLYYVFFVNIDSESKLTAYQAFALTVKYPRAD